MRLLLLHPNSHMSTLRFILTTIVVLAIQIWVLSPMMVLGIATPYIYPVLLCMLPMSYKPIHLTWIGFVLGCVLDWMLLTPGLHASALTLTAFLRYYLLQPMVDDNKPLSPPPVYGVIGMNSFVLLAEVMLVHHLWLYAIAGGITLDWQRWLISLGSGYVVSMLGAVIALLLASVRTVSR